MFLWDPTTILLAIILGFIVIKFFHNPKQRGSDSRFPPGPKALPIIGNIHILDLKRPHKSLMQLSKKYGPLFSIQIGTKKIVVLCGYEMVKEALITHAEEFSERPKIPIFQDFLKGYGIIFAHGDNWKTMRRFTLTTLRDFGMGKASLEDKIHEECGHLLDLFKSHEGKPFDNTKIMNAAVANIIVSIILGQRFDLQDPKFLRLMSLFNENIRLLGSPMITLYNTYPQVLRWVPGPHKIIVKNFDELKSFLINTFKNRVDQLERNDQRSLMDAYLIRQKEEKTIPTYFHDENLTVLLSNLFSAGTETTSTTLRWGLLLMMKYPDIQKGVQTEIDKMIGSSKPQTFHRKEMPYTDAVIHEIQRFANIIPNNLPHETTEDVEMRGYVIPKGTHIIPLLASVLRDEAHFEKPEEFYPQHFLDSNGQFMRKEAFLPFSAGKRSCAGENLAKIELFLFFTSLLQNFTFQAPPGADLDLTPAVGLSTPPQSHMICALPRN
ncbi:cytochrome P450 2K1-like [Hyperolius riggenbachi]|uniref:cytochrome P450 2K1-like n=1 Tax=Hyperolius riggenbachi TaxID=752182 RepID=UPI0035A28B20